MKKIKGDCMKTATEVISQNLGYFLQEAEAGNIAVQFELGLLYGHFGGSTYYFSVVPRDYTKAAKWLKLAADGGHSGSQYVLGDMYYFGTGLPQDYLEALKYYMLAAKQGSGEAKCAIGIMYAHGRGVLKDCMEAIKWLESSVFNSAPHEEMCNAAFNLGVIHTLLNEPGITRDYTEAYKCFKIAAEHGYEPAVVTDAIIQCMRLMESSAGLGVSDISLPQPVVHQYRHYVISNIEHELAQLQLQLQDSAPHSSSSARLNHHFL